MPRIQDALICFFFSFFIMCSYCCFLISFNNTQFQVPSVRFQSLFFFFKYLGRKSLLFFFFYEILHVVPNDIALILLHLYAEVFVLD